MGPWVCWKDGTTASNCRGWHQHQRVNIQVWHTVLHARPPRRWFKWTANSTWQINKIYSPTLSTFNNRHYQSSEYIPQLHILYYKDNIRYQQLSTCIQCLLNLLRIVHLTAEYFWNGGWLYPQISIHTLEVGNKCILCIWPPSSCKVWYRP